MSVIINGTSGISTDGGSELFGSGSIGGSLTLTSGTANGVTYLNGSKVLTSGSGLTFDGANLTATTSSLYPNITMESSGNNAIFGFRINNTGTSGVDWRVEQGRSAVGDFNLSAPSVNATPQYVILKNLSAQYWLIGSSEAMRLTSTGLGIGTSSPSYKLDVTGTSRLNGSVYLGGTGANIILGSGSYFRTSTTTGFLLNNDADTLNLFSISNTGTAIWYPGGSEAMRLTSTGLGIGTSSPGALLDVNGSPAGLLARFLNATAPTLSNDTHAGEALFLRSGGTAGSGNVQAVLAFGKADGASVRSGSAIASVQTTADADQVGIGFYTSTSSASSQTLTQAMLIDSSGNVGIGTSSPQTRLEANQTGVGSVVIPIVAANQSTSSTGTGAGIGFVVDGVNDVIGTQIAGIRTAPAYHQSAMAFYTRDSGGGGLLERMRLDSAGNLGLGVTPSAWASAYKVLQIGSASSMFNTGSSTLFVTNGYIDSGYAWRYQNSSYSSRYTMESGGHAWFTAPSGTAGNALSFTQAMTLDASGRLGIGTSSPASYARLSVSGTAGDQTVANQQIVINAPTTTSGHGAGIRFNAASGSNEAVGVIGVVNEASGISGAMTFHVYNAGATVPEYMRITSSGSVGIGTPSPSTLLDVRGEVSVAYNATYGLRFYNQDRDNWSSIGCTVATGTASANLVFKDSTGVVATMTGGNVIVLAAGSGSLGKLTTRSDGGTPLAVSNESASGTLVALMGNGSGNLGSITHNGSSVAYNTTSDYRLKEDWVAVADASTRVNALKPVNFAWKADGKRVDGFLAHELAEVVPEAVTGEKDAVDADGNPVYQGIDQSKLVPLLTAALQEALAKIESLEARLDAAGF